MIPQDFVTEWRAHAPWDFEVALAVVRSRLVATLPGAPWKGKGA